MRVLVSPLDWGLGHASRLSRVVSDLMRDGHEVMMAGSGRSIELLKGDYPTLKCVELKSFSPWFFKRLPQWLAITMQVPTFIYYIYCERRRTEQIVGEHDIDMVVSDNRYGVRCDNCKSVIITHQLSPRIASWCPRPLEWLFALGIGRLLNKFDEVWIPDIAEFPDGIAGELAKPSANLRTKTRYVGILSRLDKNADELPKRIDHLAIISGPEPQRSIFEDMVARDFSTLGGRRVIVRGITEGEADKSIADATGTEFINHCSTRTLSEIIKSSNRIVCRSGYSTVMDLIEMKKTAYVMPTPGQAEQEYIAQRTKKYGFFTYITKYPK